VKASGGAHTAEHAFSFCHARIMSKKMEKRKGKMIATESASTGKGRPGSSARSVSL
jgi:hypothetical protein